MLVDVSRFALATAMESVTTDNDENRTRILPARLSEYTNGNTSPIVLFEAIERLKHFDKFSREKTSHCKIAKAAALSFLQSIFPGPAILDFCCGDASFLLTGMVGLKDRHNLQNLRGFGIEKIDEHLFFGNANEVVKHMKLDVDLHLGDFLNNDKETVAWLRHAVKNSQVFYACNEAWESKTISRLLNLISPWLSPLSIFICMKIFHHDSFFLIDMFYINSEDIDWLQSRKIANNIPVHVYIFEKQ